VPDRRFILSAPRTTHPLSVKFATVIASSALALGAAAAAASSAPARPTALPSADRLTTGRLTTGRLTTGRLTTGRLTTGRLTTGRLTTGRPAATHVPRSVKLATVLEPAAGTASTPRSQRQFPYLNWLWDRESSWNVHAENPYSGAYGIPQALPGAKMATAGPDWRTSARTQIRWGLRYIRSTYGSPLRAWEHEVTYGWY